MEKVKKITGEILEKIKGLLGKIPGGIRKVLLIGLPVLIVGAVVLALLLNHQEYSVLYSEVTQEDAAAIGQKLQEMGIEYQLKPNGDIVVPSEQEDQLRASLAYEGYPKSGFSYDVFINNAGGMTTESDADTYKLYDLQNRLGATISLFDNVKDAKVTIALGEQQKYVLQKDAEEAKASASVVVQMKEGQSLSPESAAGIQNLVAHSVAGLEADDVSVFDENGIELSNSDEKDFISGDSAALARTIENEIAAKVVNLLTPVYGDGNVRVSVKASVNMERLIRESITYTTPDKIDEQDKQGIVSKESLQNEQGQGGGAEGGVAGAETNADITNYNTVEGEGGESYSASAVEREYLVNQIKEQGEISPGVLDELSISAVINSNTAGSQEINQNQLKSLIGNAAGVEPDQQDEKITVMFAPFLQEVDDTVQPFERFMEALEQNWYLLAIGCAILLLLIFLFMLLNARRKKKKRLKEEAAKQQSQPEIPVVKNPEIVNLQNEEAANSRQNVREFTEQNPEIAAQLLREWLGGGDKNE